MGLLSNSLFTRLLGASILLCSFLLAWYWMDYREFANSPLQLPEQGLVYQLRPGTSVAALAGELVQQGVLDSPLYLRLLARQRGDAERIKAGEYRIVAGTTPAQLMDQLVLGKVVQYSLTLIEGWSFAQVRAALANEPALKQTLNGKSAAEILAQLGASESHPEGLFLPDTYVFIRGDSDINFLKRAYQAMKSYLAEEWNQRAEDLPLETPYQALILASIIEKETGKEEERPAIAGVFVRRLKRGMKLQTDPTVIYGLGDAFDGNLRRRDLRRDTPYNTYTRKGLPPTPIALPGREAVQAALHPQDGKSLYFVARGDGSHAFSSTLNEHNRAVRKYQLGK